MNVRKYKHVRMPKKGGGPNFGNKCSSDEPGCIVCDAYAFKNKFGRFPYTFDELQLHRRKSML